VDAAAARARALAQASLLAMGLSVGQTSPTDLAKRVYVGNLYYDLREDDVRSFFGPFGTIRAVDLSMEPGCVQLTDLLKETGGLHSESESCCRMTRSKGYCFIEYEGAL
jgi:RNA recognition motif-containing protein